MPLLNVHTTFLGDSCESRTYWKSLQAYGYYSGSLLRPYDDIHDVLIVWWGLWTGFFYHKLKPYLAIRWTMLTP